MKRLLSSIKSVRSLAIGVIAVSSLLTGCATVQMASQDRDLQAKTYKTNVNQAKIYIYRNELLGLGIKLSVELDGKEIGATTSKSYFVVKANPGKHTIVSKGEDESAVTIMTEAGKNYFVWQEVKMGFLSARSKLQLVDTATGQAGVLESKLIETSAAGGTAAALANDNSDDGGIAIQKLPFRTGTSSVTVERLAQKNSCISSQGASLMTPPGAVEVYKMNCNGGGTFLARCELRQCQEMK